MLLKLLLGSAVSVAHWVNSCGEKITDLSGVHVFWSWYQDRDCWSLVEKHRWMFWYSWLKGVRVRVRAGVGVGVGRRQERKFFGRSLEQR